MRGKTSSVEKRSKILKLLQNTLSFKRRVRTVTAYLMFHVSTGAQMSTDIYIFTNLSEFYLLGFLLAATKLWPR